MRDICFIPITESQHPLVDRIAVTYEQSFPVAERRPFPLVRELIDAHPSFTANALLRGDAYLGFITSWEFEAFRYVEHFAIDASARNSGVGGEALRLFLGQNNQPVVLEVELPENDLNRRRIAFYERQGFVFYDQPYFQPPYHPEEPVSLELRLMTWGEVCLDRTFDEWTRLIHREVYGM